MQYTALLQLVTAAAGSVGFALVFNIQKEKLIWAALGGLLSWASYLLLKAAGVPEYACGFLAAAITTAYSELMARVTGTPAIVFIMVCTVPLIPGAALYRSMDALMHSRVEDARSYGLYALLFAASMAAGIVLTTLLEKAGNQQK